MKPAREGRLKACPFCGELPTRRDHWFGFPGLRSRIRLVQCESDECGVRPKTSGSDAAEAARLWNTRAKP